MKDNEYYNEQEGRFIVGFAVVIILLILAFGAGIMLGLYMA